ncbi:MAG: hypothetical protein AB8B55_07590 [Mariniblastus sp.]
MNSEFKILIVGVLFSMTGLGLGCQAQTHPWDGKPYQPPSEIQPPAQSTYAPMPSILPSVEASKYGPALELNNSIEAMEAELELDAGFPFDEENSLEDEVGHEQIR